MPRFLQLHTLTSYPASLLNRDDVGFAKRLPFGDAERVRISSQCLKRHWRRADGEHALRRIQVNGEGVPMAIRSRRIFGRHVFEPLVRDGVPDEVAAAVTEELLKRILPEGKAKKKRGAPTEAGEEGGEEAPAAAVSEADLRTEQVIVLGEPEVSYLRRLAAEIAAGAENASGARKAAVQRLKGDLGKNLQTLARGAGLDAALFGRMTTGDVLARCDAAIHVAHAFTVHSGNFETDYFSAVDDLQGPAETGSGHINTAELTSGVYYGYVVVDVPLLVSNLEGTPQEEWEKADRALAAEVVRHLVHLIATVTPGAKLGATAPYAHALMVLGESGNAMPRTLANAFLAAVCEGQGGDLLRASCEALGGHLAALDQMYGRTTSRRLATIAESDRLAGVSDQRGDLPSLAAWAASELQGES